MGSKSTFDEAEVAELLRVLGQCDRRSTRYQQQRDRIVQRCLPLADRIARRFRGRGEPLDDLVQAARLGLIKAVDRFDVDHGSDFVAFAVPTIIGELRRHFRDHSWSVTVPRRHKDLFTPVNKACDSLFQRLGRAPTATEIAEHLGVDREQVIQAQIAANAYSTTSIDTPLRGDEDGDARYLTGNLGALDANLDKVLDVESVRPLLAGLPDRERIILQLRFFENMTQTQIARQLGISQMHVSRLLSRTLTALRGQLEAHTAAHEKPCRAANSARHTTYRRPTCVTAAEPATRVPEGVPPETRLSCTHRKPD